MNTENALRILNASLRVGFFLMMGLGLLLASGFLLYGKIDGGEWVALCTVLFSADRIGNAIGSKM